MKKHCKEPIPTVGIQLAKNVCNILEAYLTKNIFKMPENVEKNKTRLSHIFVFAFIWGMGGALDSDYHMQVIFFIKINSYSFFSLIISLKIPLNPLTILVVTLSLTISSILRKTFHSVHGPLRFRNLSIVKKLLTLICLCLQQIQPST